MVTSGTCLHAYASVCMYKNTSRVMCLCFVSRMISWISEIEQGRYCQYDRVYHSFILCVNEVNACQCRYSCNDSTCTLSSMTLYPRLYTLESESWVCADESQMRYLRVVFFRTVSPRVFVVLSYLRRSCAVTHLPRVRIVSGVSPRCVLRPRKSMKTARTQRRTDLRRPVR